MLVPLLARLTPTLVVLLTALVECRCALPNGLSVLSVVTLAGPLTTLVTHSAGLFTGSPAQMVVVIGARGGVSLVASRVYPDVTLGIV